MRSGLNTQGVRLAAKHRVSVWLVDVRLGGQSGKECVLWESWRGKSVYEVLLWLIAEGRMAVGRPGVEVAMG